MARWRYVDYPRVVYGPHGASLTISGPSGWPQGWAATPARGAPVTVAAAAEIPYSRAAMKRMLRERGVVFDESAADSALYDRLQHG